MRPDIVLVKRRRKRVQPRRDVPLQFRLTSGTGTKPTSTSQLLVSLLDISINLHWSFVLERGRLDPITGQQSQAPVAERVTSRSRLQRAEGAMGSSRSISSHCDPKTLSAIDLAFDSAWNVLETRDLLARFTRILSECRDQSAACDFYLGRRDQF